MPDYQKSKIYKLWSPTKNLIYYGSTTETLAQRLSKHKAKHKIYNNDNNKPYYTSFLVLDCEDYKIELVEEYPCNNRTQLATKEGEYIRNNECCNRFIAGRGQKEWSKDYYIKNADKISEQRKQYYKENIDKLKEKHKQYYNDNIDKINEQKRQYSKQYYLKKKTEGL